jgi:hypothetical protein
MYDGVSKSFCTGRLEQELQMVQLSTTRCSCIAILWVILVSFVSITLCIVSQRVFIVIVVVYFVIDSIRKLLVTPSYAKIQKYNSWNETLLTTEILCYPTKWLVPQLQNCYAAFYFGYVAKYCPMGTDLQKNKWTHTHKLIFYSHIYMLFCRSQWPSGLRQVMSTTARTLGSHVRILLRAWMCVRVFLCCVVLCR